MTKWFSPPQVAKAYGVQPEKIRRLIETGQLAAVNIAIDPKGERPRWRVSEEALANFEAARAPVVPAPKPTRRRKLTGIVRHFRGGQS